MKPFVMEKNAPQPGKPLFFGMPRFLVHHLDCK